MSLFHCQFMEHKTCKFEVCMVVHCGIMNNNIPYPYSACWPQFSCTVKLYMWSIVVSLAQKLESKPQKKKIRLASILNNKT